MVSRFGNNFNFPVLKSIQELSIRLKKHLLKSGDVVYVDNHGELLTYQISQNGRAILA